MQPTSRPHSSSQRVLGVDPGSLRFGWGIIEVTGADMRYIASGVFRMPARDPLPERLGKLLTHLEALLLDHRVDTVAVEQAFVYKNPRTALVIGQARGLPIALAAARGLQVAEYQPATVKQAVVGSGRASKEQVSHMVQLQLGLKELPQEDEGDALAVALTHGRQGGGQVEDAMAETGQLTSARAYYAAVMAGAKGRKRR